MTNRYANRTVCLWLFVIAILLSACLRGESHALNNAPPRAAAERAHESTVEPVALALMTSPRHVYKQNDGKDGHGSTESFVFRLVVREAKGRAAEPEGATVELRSGVETVETIRYSAKALGARRGHASTPFSPDFDALYALRFAFKEAVALGIDAALVRLDTSGASASLLVPVGIYAQKTKLRFPVPGDFMVVTGSAVSEGGHEERSQTFAYDVVGLGPHLELLRGDGTKNTDFIGYGRDVLAPADGIVSYARNDVADNPASGNQDMSALLRLPDPPWGVAGNCVVIDHGTGEWSLLAHMQPGSVRTKKGDRVKQGEVIGKLGNSGATTGPHLHYHLMDGPELLRSDGLPVHFDNACVPQPKPGQYCDAK
jgi:murein DD-endopeptidase MepM/ murein hydrolase activator NlpD